MFQDALIKQGRSPATVVSYLDLLERRASLSDYFTPGMAARIESPGENFDVERDLLRRGFEDAESEGSACLDPEAIDRLAYDCGRILYPRQWFLGFKRFLTSLASYPVRWMNAPDEIVTMFDKTETHRRCKVASISVPEAIDGVRTFDELIAVLETLGWNRVFVKLAHSSSASGVGAFYYSKRHGTMRLATSTEMVRDDSGGLKLYNSLKIRTYTSYRDIAVLVDEWCRHRVHVEQWLPKAGQDGLPFDLRIVSIGGEPSHSVVRLGRRSPITNLHLGNKRGDFKRLAESMGAEKLNRVHQTCRNVAKLFPGSHTIGIDLLLTPRYQKHFILELNAFGDLLPNVHFHGRDTYEQEIVAWFQKIDNGRDNC